MKYNHGKPLATYRLQFNHNFRLADAAALVPYFSRLGITHVYASPILRARETSTHGYDVVDPKTINPNLGDEADLIELATDLRKLGLGLILDIVPNHMAASIDNPYWRDVLTYGPSSPFAGWFDIHWRMPDPDLWGRVLVPVLGEPRARVLEQDHISVVWSDGRFLVKYFEHVFPVDPATVPAICAFGLDHLRQRLGEEHPTLQRIREILAWLKKLPSLVVRLRRRVTIDRDETEQWLAQFAQVVVQSPHIQQWAEETAKRFGQGVAGRRRLKKLLDGQPYRLVHWRDAARTINYRRFFDINELISIRQEDPQVFQETHSTILRWVDDGLIDGLRIDHIDGLRDPLGYLERLVEALSESEATSQPVPVFVEKILAWEEKLPCGWPVAGTTGYEFLNQAEGVFISPSGLAEIEARYRRMLHRPVQFDDIASNAKRRVLRDDLSPQVGRLADRLLRLAERGRQAPSEDQAAAMAEFAAVDPPGLAAATAVEHQQSVFQNDTAAGWARLASDAELTKSGFVDAIVEVIAALPVYRTYVDGNQGTLNDTDRHYVQIALEGARNSGRAAPEAVEVLGEVLLLENKSCLEEHDLHERARFVQRFQQLTGPAAAKGIEDTALYAYVPLVSLNEVGGEPHLPAEDPLRRLHHANEDRAAAWPAGMLCVTTHDTKRTADVRARLDVLSELPKLWFGLVRRWRRLHKPRRAQVRGKQAPDAATEYLFYQTVVGVWPPADPSMPNQPPDPKRLTELRERIEGYMLKAVREAKTHTSWTNSDQEYEDAVLSFVRGLLSHDGPNCDGPTRDGNPGGPFLSDVQNLVARIAQPGFWNSLSRTLLQFTAPGTPDLYQGDELWNFALVDPDNRREVDFSRRQRLLDEVIVGIESPPDKRQAFVKELVAAPEDSRIKLHVIRTALAARREHPTLFGDGRYVPLSIRGPAEDHLLAFARTASSSAEGGDGTEDVALVVVPRWTTALVAEPQDPPIGESVWSGTTLQLPAAWSKRMWTSVLTRDEIHGSSDGLDAANLLRTFPVALLLGR